MLKFVSVLLFRGMSAVVLFAFASGDCTAATTPREQFAYRSITCNGLTLPYREARIVCGDSTRKAALIVYLHGGLRRGDDNAAQLEEPGVGAIAEYLRERSIPSILLVPQCPCSKQWGEETNDALRVLIDRYVETGEADERCIYLLGGSMGGTGTWSMLDARPTLFAAAMPVAGQPLMTHAAQTAKTPVYAVLGADDDLIPVRPVSDFVERLRTGGAEVMLDVIPDWTHAATCTESYTAERLDWVFGHMRPSLKIIPL